MAEPSAPAAPKISSKLLGMKFMQRRQESDLRAKLQREDAQRHEEARWVLAQEAAADGGGPRVQLESEAASSTAGGGARAAAVLDFRPSRRSFGKFNPKTDTALAAVRDAQAAARRALEEAATERERAAVAADGPYDEGTVADDEMARRYKELMGRGQGEDDGASGAKPPAVVVGRKRKAAPTGAEPAEGQEAAHVTDVT